MTSYHRPAQMIRLRFCCFGATGYIIDADRSTLSFDPEALEGRLSTGYPVDLSWRSSTCWVAAESDLWGRSSKSEAPSLKNEDGRVAV
jgi:hypothetical protein